MVLVELLDKTIVVGVSKQLSKRFLQVLGAQLGQFYADVYDS